ncbi:hypothetical protein HZA40_02035 [Candidatus Peregrinibacteria bacterium]|nr:hypothetical protein [Candidatus Peregrinibacteria bacterium]
MKKLVVALSLLMAVGLFQACSVKEQFSDEPLQVSKTGLLVEQTAKDKESGTHFVVDDKNQKTAARSLTINLSANEYLGNKVTAYGIMNQTDNVLEITGLSVEEILSKNTKQDKAVEEPTRIDAQIDAPKTAMDMTTFASLPYKFGGKYPSKWYYAGIKSSGDDGVLHHYSFSDKVLDGKNEILALDVLSGSIPVGGDKITFDGKNFVVFEGSATYTVYTTFQDKNFRLAGPSSYKDLILNMAASIGPLEGST